MQNSKDNIRSRLLITGRRLAAEKGTTFVTARKLSEASGCSIGTIYNQFASMDDFIAEQNQQTLTELYAYLSQLQGSRKGYRNLNAYAECFQNFVSTNRELWLLFYNFHLNLHGYVLSIGYRRLLINFDRLLAPDLQTMFPDMNFRRLKMAQKVLQTSLVALSAFNLSGNSQRESWGTLLLNTYLAGMMMLNKE